MFIDIHAHITYGDYPEFARTILGRPGFDVNVLLRRMDFEGIEKSVVLPLVNAEVLDRYGVAGNQEVLKSCQRHPDRLIPFCCVDPRNMLYTHQADARKHGGFYKLLKLYRDLGCRGIGEVCGSIAIDDPRYQEIYGAAGELRMPLVFHFQPFGGYSYGVNDDLHLPGLERMLKMFPETHFIGHSMAFWSEIAGDVNDSNRENYGTTEYSEVGELWRLFATYKNLGGDISAGSGAAAFSRDEKHGLEFFERFQDQLFFGTDRFSAEDEPMPPQIPMMNGWLADKKISSTVYDKVASGNFLKIMAEQ